MEKNGIVVIEIWSSSDEEEDDDESPVVFTRSINSAMKDENKKKKTRTFGNDDDCLILDFNPFESIKKLSIKDDDDEDISVVAEIGQVACRDYPHSRHLCVKFPFNKSPHSSYCEQCYCYVCDSTAPCTFWSSKGLEHCHATEHDPKWKLLRASIKTVRETIPKTS